MTAACRASAILTWSLFASALACFASHAFAADASAVPYLTGRVVDNAEILKPATRERLTATLKAHETATGDQIAVLTVPTINDMSVEECASKSVTGSKVPSPTSRRAESSAT
jgi:uncharacterized membrane protein YgcG